MMNNLPVNGHRLWLASLRSSTHTLSNRDLFSSPASSITITVAVTVSVAIITSRRYLRFPKMLHLTYFWKILQRYHWPSRFKYAQIFAKFSKPLFKKNWRCEIFLNWGLKKESSPMCCPRFTHGFPHNFQPVRSSRSISYSLRTNKYMIEGLKYIDLCTVKMMHYNILV